MIKKNKPVTIILLLAVASIYGTIIYRSFTSNTLIETGPSSNPMVTNVMATNYLKDSFKIDFFLNDPFNTKTNHISFQKKIHNLPNNIGNKKVGNLPPVKNAPLKWPEVKYFGFVKNKQKNKGLSLISIDGQLLKVANGDINKGVKFLSSTLDSARFYFNGVVKSIAK